jgi:hypothetical protein
MYNATIYISCLFGITLLGAIIYLIKYYYDKDCRGPILFFIIIELIFALLIIPAVYRDDKRNVDYPYDKIMTVRLYYVDGGSKVMSIRCKGWENPYLQRSYGACIFNLNSTSIPCVTRYDIVDIKKVDKR